MCLPHENKGKSQISHQKGYVEPGSWGISLWLFKNIPNPQLKNSVKVIQDVRKEFTCEIFYIFIKGPFLNYIRNILCMSHVLVYLFSFEYQF
eukprot:UN32244